METLLTIVLLTGYSIGGAMLLFYLVVVLIQKIKDLKEIIGV